jgi:hypothetical protein
MEASEAGIRAAETAERFVAPVIAHVILFKPRPDLSVTDRLALATTFEQAAKAIPSVRRVTVGKRIAHGTAYETSSPDVADFIIILEFENLDGLQMYLRDPAHEELAFHYRHSLVANVAYDFEIGGLEKLVSLA